MTPHERLSFSIMRVIDAPCDEVFAAWTEKDLLEQWMCRDVPAHRAEYTVLDVRPGGRYVIEIALPDGGMYRGSGVFREVVRPERLVFTWFWERLSAGASNAMPESNESVITIQLEARGARTAITLTHDGIDDERARIDSERGWSGCLDVLHDVLFARR